MNTSGVQMCAFICVCVCVSNERASERTREIATTDDDSNSNGRDEAKKTFNEQQNLIKVIKLVFKCTLHLAFYMCTLNRVEWMRVEYFCIGAVLLLPLLFLLLLIFLIFCKRFVSSSL